MSNHPCRRCTSYKIQITQVRGDVARAARKVHTLDTPSARAHLRRVKNELDETRTMYGDHLQDEHHGAAR